MGCLHSVSEKCPRGEIGLKPAASLHLKEAFGCSALQCSCGQYCSSFESPVQMAQQQQRQGVTTMNGDLCFRSHEVGIHDSSSRSQLALFPRPFVRRKKSRPFDIRVSTKYNIISLIGKGSFSIVLKVQHRETGGAFAMKMMPANRGKGPFENELLILSRIRHQNVTQLIEVFQTNTRVYVVLELATGGELYDRITQKGCYTEPEGIFAVKQILQGVSYLHRVGVTHRDLKPENLLYATSSADSKLMITDFGLAHLKQSSAEQYMVDPCGTPEYIAPEILTRLPYTNKVDIWAVGVIAYILLSGIMPFDDENRTALYRQILRGKYHFYPEFWCGVSDEAKQFVSSLLCVDAELRPTADMSLRHPWLQNSPSKSNLETVPRAVHKSYSLNVESKRTKSSRSIRSVARSDAGRRIKKDEVERLHKDPEILKILNSRQTLPFTRNYGLV
ncbi:serine:threonine protein kinase H1 [Trichuris trichiura]|uniref:Serine:threonine protein kinase H1 n=1 Tax=Trichuris trichiura TaxID=36087 RepID=A0A077ZF79_TRITR|nr:serine:threonine protein kinase H1 [Trichuris trichiura]